jgi:hypothetical protein
MRASHKRFELLVSPREWVCLPVGDPARQDRFKSLVSVMRVNRPLTPRLVAAAMQWALECVRFTYPDEP